MASSFSIFDSFIQNSNQIIFRSTLNHCQIFNKKSILNIPPNMKNPTSRIQQILKLFLVYLKVRSFHIKLFRPQSHLLPHILYSSRNNPISIISLPPLYPQPLFLSSHRVSLTTTRLAIRKYRCRVAFQGRINQLVHSARIEHILLARTFIKHCIELESFLSLRSD